MSKTAGRSALTNSPFCGVLVCAFAADAAQLARTTSAAQRQSASLRGFYIKKKERLQ
jgi:hypothetical protein